mmetsp:Transcript_25457/g.33156  ORF Transcript_25457/g.33156 Transcript_25457/m.33156 type:complete len:95 (+) Transcript_25457:214-498(+)|eukprot:CAMPEP_0114359854 /NCGR_PEP_ID=MMETSP0101-20121206/23337_1 /TAXON_ID=38822 ORGANISM="Pteridomonas danica, Strain PT" /NCGR_SAMPLE_ID=MMETSP0101 /ASSEMBLY_ACC=CAM_ASM_000211 /LENGTH=94 /DNA_ID=CAMNT_0001503621 /DNA_START=77 /DNA_END=361 /DNA_ORIENTATION=-
MKLVPGRLRRLVSAIQEEFPSYEVTLEGSASEYMVIVQIDGVDVWSVDTRVSAILKNETAMQAIEAIKEVFGCSIEDSKEKEDNDSDVNGKVVT